MKIEEIITKTATLYSGPLPDETMMFLQERAVELHV